MLFIDLACKLIPGYKLLSDEQRNTFERSEIGQHFVNVTNELLQVINTRYQNTSFVYSAWAVLIRGRDLDSDFGAEFLKKKNALLEELKTCKEYKTVITSIIYAFLDERFSPFAVLSSAQKRILVKAGFSQPLQAIALEQTRAKAERTFEKNQLSAQQKKVLQQWHEEFRTQPDMAPLRATIARSNAEKRANELRQLFPLLNNAIKPLEPTPITDYIDLYCEKSQTKNPDFEQMDKAFLTTVLFHYLQKASVKYIKFIELHNFNIKMANRLAKKILNAEKGGNALRMNHWLERYQVSLAEHLGEKLVLINGKERKIAEKVQDDSGLLNSLSYLFWHSKAVNKTTDFFNKLADAHAFIQYTGMSTQNESSYLVILDLYNYNRSSEQITETKAIFSSLAKPFLPLYEEYKEIAFFEKSGFRKIFRTLMPLLIIAGVVVIVAAMLSPLGIPELAFLIAAIPAVLIGLYLASKYVTWKNEVYRYHRQKSWGGTFEIPEFQINPRMTQIFGNEEGAELIRGIYIEELKICDEIENSYSERAENGLLTEAELEARKQNIIKRHSLGMEWYDIHSNYTLGHDKVPQIVQTRLNQIADEETQQLKQQLEKVDRRQMDACLQSMVNELKASFAPPVAVDNRNLAPQVGAIPIPMLVLVPQQYGPQAVAQPNPIPRFFQPSCLAHQRKAETMDSALKLISEAQQLIVVNL